MDRRWAGLLTLVMILLLTPGLGRERVLASPESGLDGQSAEPPGATFHVVQRGETLFSIAEQYGSTVDAVAHANGLHDPTKIYAGQRLSIPNAGVRPEPETITSYVVQPGDSLMGVAVRYATSWRSLARLNGLTSPRALYANQVIQVPARDRAGQRGGALHVAGDGDTLFRIALQYDTAPWSLITANDGVSPARVYAGQPLFIPGTGAGGLPMPFESIDVRPLPAVQGDTLVFVVHMKEPVRLTGRLFDRTVHFGEEKGVYYGLAGVHVFTESGLYEAVLRATDSDERVTEVTVDVIVEADSFGYERIKASASLLDPAVVAAEQAKLDALRPRFTPERMWSEAFVAPCGGTISSYFGSRRAYNEGPYTSYHGGVDLRGATGTPVYAPAGGTVVFVDALAVRGGALVLDHGWGVLTGYWHLSAIEVEVGQRVEQGDLIARIGNTGLSTGSHLHWEMWVGGVNVNPLHWLDPFYPWPQGGTKGEQGDMS